MNSKKAKKIRRQARQDTIGQPDVQYGTIATKDVKAPVMSKELTPGGESRPRAVRILRTARVLTHDCTRMLYKVRKRSAK